jgi:hypothetical protein
MNTISQSNNQWLWMFQKAQTKRHEHLIEWIQSMNQSMVVDVSESTDQAP